MSTPQTRLPSTAYFVRRLLAYHLWSQVASGCCWVLFHPWPLFPGLLAKAFFDLLQGRAPAYVTLQRLVALVVALAPPRAAYTPQVPTLLSGTLRENLLLGRDADDRALHRAIDCAVLEADLATFPAGLETLIGARGVRLSGGQIQRTAAARMFVRESDLLVMDDLSSALDVETEHLLWQRLLARRDATVLAVSHRPLLLRAADQVIVLEEGRLVAMGPPDEVLSSLLQR